MTPEILKERIAENDRDIEFYEMSSKYHTRLSVIEDYLKKIAKIKVEKSVNQLALAKLEEEERSCGNCDDFRTDTCCKFGIYELTPDFYCRAWESIN